LKVEDNNGCTVVNNLILEWVVTVY
jgi:hypothetical protein